MDTLTVTFRIVRLTSKVFIGMGTVAGISIRGGSRPTPEEAAQSFFEVLSGQSGNRDDSLIAISLLIAGTNLDEIESPAIAATRSDSQ